MRTAFLKAIELIFSGSDVLAGIIGVTLRMSITSSLAALLLGAPLGVVLAMERFPGRQALIVINRTLMGVPPVVCGLICYMLFSGVGALGSLRLLYTVNGMIIAQILLIAPVMAGTMETYLRPVADTLNENARGLSLSRGKTYLLTVNESRYQLISAWLMGFSRAIAEVGAVSMVGGAIAYKTNVMTTAIMMYTNRGDFTLGLALGMILLIMSLVLNIAVYLLQGRLSK